MYPEKIDQISDNVITMKWDDGHESLYFAAHVRKNCPCARCADEKAEKKAGPFNVLKTRVQDVTFTGWQKIGRYAVAFKFSDGHTTGIYSYETLRDLCQCDECENNVIRIQGPLK